MGKTSKILRQSIFLFLQNYHYFTSAPTFLAFPFAIFALLSQCYVPSSNVFPLVHTRLRSSLSIASGSRILSSDLIMNVKLSKTILTYFFVSPFAYSFLLLAKSSVIIEFFNQRNAKQASSKPSLISIFKHLIFTQVLNSLLIISLNAVCFLILFICFSFLDNSPCLSSRGTLAIFSSISAIAYSFVLAYAYIICNLSLVVSGLEKHGGFVSVLKACALMHGRSPSSTAVSLAVLTNTALVGVEALFHYRVLSATSVTIDSAIVMEGLFIAYLYAILLVLDTVVTCVFWRRWGEDYRIDREDYYIMYSLDHEKLLP